MGNLALSMDKLIFIFLITFFFRQGIACESRLQASYQSAYGQFQINAYQDYSELILKNGKIVFTNSNNCRKLFAKSYPFPNSFALTSTTQLPSFIRWDKISSVKFFLGKNYIWSDKFDLEKIKDFSLDFPLELFVKEKLGLLIVYSDIFSASQKKKLLELNIPFLVIDDHLSGHPLKRAEWNILTGFLIGHFLESVQEYKNIEKNYSEIKSSKGMKKKVLVGNFQGSVWSAPGRLSDLGILIKDAGGELLASHDFSGSKQWSLEEIVKLKLKADIWLTHNHWISKDQMEKEKNSKYISAIQVFNNNKRLNSRLANDFWESGLSRPDLLLLEIKNIINDRKIEHMWYRELK